MDLERNLPLAPRDLMILTVLAEGPLHGYGIIKSVERRSRSGVLLDPANLYRVLRRMRTRGWIREDPSGSSTAGDGAHPRHSAETPVSETSNSADSEGGGERRRRTYVITRAGRSILSAEVARLERLLKQVRPALADGDG